MSFVSFHVASDTHPLYSLFRFTRFVFSVVGARFEPSASSVSAPGTARARGGTDDTDGPHLAPNTEHLFYMSMINGTSVDPITTGSSSSHFEAGPDERMKGHHELTQRKHTGSYKEKLESTNDEVARSWINTELDTSQVNLGLPSRKKENNTSLDQDSG